MKAISIEQLYATLKSISQSVFKHISKAQETADKAQETANAKMGAVNPTVTGYFAMNPPVNYVPGTKSHSEGGNCRASGGYSHAEGQQTIASGWCSHAEGEHTEAAGAEAHAEGRATKALGNWSHAEGNETIAACNFQHVEGMFNIIDEKNAAQNGKGKYIHIVGNGTGEIINGDEAVRSNAHTLDWDGNAWYKGDVYVGGTGQDDENASKLIAQKDIGDGLEVVDGKLRVVSDGVWELIEETILTESVESFSRNEEPDGTPYNYKAVVVRANFANVIVDYSASIYSFIANSYDIYCYKASKKVENAYSIWGCVDNSGYAPIINCCIAANAGSSIVDAFMGLINTTYKNTNFQTKLIENITLSGVLPEGVKISVWGVRA